MLAVTALEKVSSALLLIFQNIADAIISGGKGMFSLDLLNNAV